MFTELGVVGNALILLASLAVLMIASELTVNNSVKVSDITRLGKTTVGFVLVAFATSLPELSIAVFAAFNPESVGISFGNVLGANILNITLILGICILIVALKRPRSSKFLITIAKEEMGDLHFGLFIASIIPLALLYIGHASRFIGMLLLGIFVFYMVQLARARKTKDGGNYNSASVDSRVSKYVLLTLAGATVVVASAFFIVESASFIANSFGIPSVIIGATIVSFGTTLPEFATSVSSVKRGHFNLALGNLVGSCFVNITCILGVALIASPLAIDIAAFYNVALFSLITNLLLWYFLSSEKIGWREGVLLLALYAVFLVSVSGEVVG